MGNRALVYREGNELNVALYLHWNGGENTVRALLEHMRASKLDRAESDDQAFYVSLCCVARNYFGKGDTSLYLVPCYSTEEALGFTDDNGAFVVRGFDIVARSEGACPCDDATFEEAFDAINYAQPAARGVCI